MTDKQINKWLRRQFSQVGWVLLGYYGLMTLLTALTMSLDAARQILWDLAYGNFGGEIDMDALLGNAWGYVLTIAVGFILLHAWKGSEYWQQALLVKRRGMDRQTLLCLLSFCIGTQMINSLWITVLEMLLNPFGLSAIGILESVSGDSDTFSMFLYSAILAPVAEEVLFRGFILRSLQPYGKRFAIWGSAILFGLFHGNLLQTPYAILMGLVLGYAAMEYSLGWAIGLHMFNNLVLADLFTRMTANLPDVVYGALNLLIFGGFALISGLILVVFRQEIREYRRSEWMDRRVVKCFFTNSGVLLMTALAVYNMISLLFV